MTPHDVAVNDLVLALLDTTDLVVLAHPPGPGFTYVAVDIRGAQFYIDQNPAAVRKVFAFAAERDVRTGWGDFVARCSTMHVDVIIFYDPKASNRPVPDGSGMITLADWVLAREARKDPYRPAEGPPESHSA